MDKVKFFSFALIAVGFSAFAQEIELAKKAIDAEQFENAKTILKSVVKT